MYKKLVLLSPRDDQKTLFAIAPNLSHLAQVTGVPIGLSEAAAVANDYPILFSSDDPATPMAILGLQGSNRYVSADGTQWSASVMPGWIRLYPFVLVSVRQDGSEEPVWALARDAAAPHFTLPGGKPLYDASGNPSPLLQQVLQHATQQQQECLKAQALATQLVEAGLLIDRTITLEMSGDVRRYSGFRAMDGDRLAALDAHTRDQLEQSGALSLLALHKASLAKLLRIYEPKTN